MFSASLPELSGRRQLLLLLVMLAGAAAGVLARSLDPLPLLLLGAALVGGLLTLFRVEFGVLALIFVAYTRFSDVLLEHGAPLSVVELMVAGMLLVMVLRWYFFDEMPEGWLRPAVYLGLYGLVGLASVLYATDGELALASWINYLQDGILVLLLVAGLQQAGALRRASWVLLLAGAFMGTLSVFQQVTGAFDSNFAGFSVVELEHIAGGTSGFRIGGPMGAPNYYAMILLPLVPLAIDRLWHERPWPLRLAGGYALVVILLSLIFTYSRGGVLGLLVVLGLSLVRLRRHPRFLLLLAVGGLLFLLILPAGFRARLATIPETLLGSEGVVPTELSIRGRTSEWLVGWQMFLDHPLGGVGLDNYPVHYLDYSSELGLDWRRTGRSPHSLYLEIASETGVLGLLAFLTLIGGIYHSLAYAYRMFRLAGHEERAGLVVALAIGFTGYFTASLFLHAAYPRFFWTLVAIAFATPVVAARTAQEGA